MKRYSVRAEVAMTEQELKEAGLEHITEKEIQEYLEDEFTELVQSGNNYYDTEFKVEEIDELCPV